MMATNIAGVAFQGAFVSAIEKLQYRQMFSCSPLFAMVDNPPISASPFHFRYLLSNIWCSQDAQLVCIGGSSSVRVPYVFHSVMYIMLCLTVLCKNVYLRHVCLVQQLTVMVPPTSLCVTVAFVVLGCR